VNSVNSDEVDVMYLDYGMTEFIAKTDVIAELPPEVEASFHTVVYCQLDGVLPV